MKITYVILTLVLFPLLPSVNAQVRLRIDIPFAPPADSSRKQRPTERVYEGKLYSPEKIARGAKSISEKPRGSHKTANVASERDPTSPSRSPNDPPGQEQALLITLLQKEEITIPDAREANTLFQKGLTYNQSLNLINHIEDSITVSRLEELVELVTSPGYEQMKGAWETAVAVTNGLEAFADERNWPLLKTMFSPEVFRTFTTLDKTTKAEISAAASSGDKKKLHKIEARIFPILPPTTAPAEKSASALTPTLAKQLDRLLSSEIDSQDALDALTDFIDEHYAEMATSQKTLASGKIMFGPVATNKDMTLWWYRPPSERAHGLGISLENRPENSYPVIKAVIPDSPASNAPLNVGDSVRRIQDADISGKSAEEAVNILQASEDGVSLNLLGANGVANDVVMRKGDYWIPPQAKTIQDQSLGITLTVGPEFFSRPSRARKDRSAYFFQAKERDETGIIYVEMSSMNDQARISDLPWTKESFPPSDRDSISIQKVQWNGITIPLVRQEIELPGKFYFGALLPTAPKPISVKAISLTTQAEKARAQFISFLNHISAERVVK